MVTDGSLPTGTTTWRTRCVGFMVAGVARIRRISNVRNKTVLKHNTRITSP